MDGSGSGSQSRSGSILIARTHASRNSLSIKFMVWISIYKSMQSSVFLIWGWVWRISRWHFNPYPPMASQYVLTANFAETVDRRLPSRSRTNRRKKTSTRTILHKISTCLRRDRWCCYQRTDWTSRSVECGRFAILQYIGTFGSPSSRRIWKLQHVVS